MRIGIIAHTGKLGYSIRTNAFINAIQNSKEFEVVHIQLGKLDYREVLLSALGNLKEVFRPALLDEKKHNIKADYLGRKLDKIVEKEKIDLLQAESTLCAFTWLHSRRLRPCIFDMHGLSYEQRIEQGLIKNKAEDAHWKKLQESVIAAADHIFAVSTPMVDYLAHYLPRDQVTIVPSGGEILPFQAQYSSPLKLIYAGVFEYWERVEDFVEMSKFPVNAAFYLMGGGRLKAKILNNPGKCQYIGYLPRNEALQKLADFQVGVSPSSMDIARAVASPIKVFDYMSVGLPVLVPDIGDWAQLIRQHACGIVVERNEPACFVEAIKALNEDTWRAMSANGKRLVQEEYNWEGLIRDRAFPVYRQFR